MAQQYTREAIRTYFNDASVGLYRDGQAAASVSEADLRAHVTRFLDSMMHREDFAPIEVSGSGTYIAEVFAFSPVTADSDIDTALYGGPLVLRFGAANTGASTLRIDSDAVTGLAYDLLKNVDEPLEAGDIANGDIALVAFDAINETYQIVCRRQSTPGTQEFFHEQTVTSAEILSANSSPVELVAAPGANKFIVPVKVIASMDYNSVAYATNTSVRIRLGVTSIVTFGSLIDQTADTVNFALQPGAGTVNVNLNFFVQTGDPTAGNSDVKVKVWYYLIDVTA